MATAILEYDGRNSAMKQLLKLFVTLGGSIIETEPKSGSLKKALKDVEEGRVHSAKDVDDLMKQILD